MAAGAMKLDPIRICESYDQITELMVPVLWGLGLVMVPIGAVVAIIVAVF